MPPTWLIVYAALSLTWIAAGIGAMLAHRRRPTRASGELPPVTILKPLCGTDPSLEENLASYFAQEGVTYEVVFGVESALDPAIDVAERVRRRHPDVPSRVVVGPRGVGHNPKVRNLMGMMQAATHDLWLIADSNVRVRRDHARELVSVHERARGARPTRPIGLVTCSFRGVGERTMGGLLDAIRLNAFVSMSTVLCTQLGKPLVVGKTMLLSRRRLESLGGLTRVADVLAEDYVLGSMFKHAGYDVVVAPTAVDNVVGALSLSGFVRRQLRWAMLRARLSMVASLLEIAVSPLTVALVALGAGSGLLALVALTALLCRDATGWLIHRGPARLPLVLLLSPLAELCGLVVCALGPLKRSVRWRDARLLVGPGTLLFDAPPRADAGDRAKTAP